MVGAVSASERTVAPKPARVVCREHGLVCEPSRFSGLLAAQMTHVLDAHGGKAFDEDGRPYLITSIDEAEVIYPNMRQGPARRWWVP